jgi:hypothetical protein
MACMMLPGCARTCGGASVFYWCWRLEHAARRPNLARTVAVDRTPAVRAEPPEAVDVAGAAARREPRADRAAVAVPVAARPIRSGVRAASPAPAPALSAAVPASPVRRRTAEPARLDRLARPAAEAPAAVAVRPARADEVATAAAPADAADPEAARAARVERRYAGHALAPAARSACDRAAAERPCPVFLFPTAVSVRADTRTVRSAPTSERHRVRVPAASRHRARHLLPTASRSPRRAAAP